MEKEKRGTELEGENDLNPKYLHTKHIRVPCIVCS
uniref:Macaca fascicularis brain cDNA, clone: QflA-16262 n=1 Tax=Macaca fascicularis TaxID=9541 RepID=I7GI09_MACFA|nr:unnamed protein product [Macaca fascicularis]